MMACLLFLSVFIVVLLFVYYVRQFGYWQRRGIQGPTAVPLFGNLFEYVIGRKHYGDVYGAIYKKYSSAKYVGVFKMSTPGLLVRDLDLVHLVMSRNFTSFEQNDFFVNGEQDPLLSANPFTRVGAEWKAARALVTPQFTISKVKAMFPAIKNACDKLGLYIATCADKEFEGMDLFYKYVVESVAACGFGLDAGSFDDEHSEFLVNSKSVFQPNLLKNLVILFFPSLLQPLAVTFIPARMDKWLRSIVNQVMKQRHDTQAQRGDFLQALMCHTITNGREGAPPALSEDVIVGNCLMFLSEGSETSAITLTYAFYELARNPEVQDELAREIMQSGEMTSDSIADMKYLEQVVLETLRMHSTISAITKICNSRVEVDGQFNGDEEEKKKLVIEPGTKIIIPVHEIQMDEEHFKDAHQFKPERFAKENSHTIKKMSLLAFGEGPRMCVGKTFGIYQVKAAIASIIFKYRVELSDKMGTGAPKQSPKSFTLFCDTGIWIKLTPRRPK